MGMFDDNSDNSGSPFSGMDPRIALAMAMSQAGGAMMQGPSRVPISPLYSIGQGAAAAPQGLMNYAMMQRMNNENQMNNMNMQYMKAVMPLRMQFLKSYLQQNGTPDSPSSPSMLPQTPAGMPQTTATTTQGAAQPMSFLSALNATEGGSNKNAVGDGGSAVGPFQFHPAAAEEMGVTDRSDPMQAAIGAQKYVAKYGAGTPNPQLYGTVAFKAGPQFAGKWDGNISSIPQPAQSAILKMDGLMGGQLIKGQQPQAPGQPAPLSPQEQEIMDARQEVARAQGAMGGQVVGVNIPGASENLKAAQDRLTNAIKAKQEVEVAGPKALATGQAEAQTAGPKQQAVKNAENLSDAQKTFNVASSNLPRALERFQEIRNASSSASSGSWGIDSHGEGAKAAFARGTFGQALEPQTATANQTISQAINQGILPEMAPQMAGMKANKFMEGIVAGATGLNMSDPPHVKINAVNGLQRQYIANLKAASAQRRSYGDTAAPSDADIDRMAYPTPDAVGKAYSTGALTKPEATAILRQIHGFSQ